MPSRNSQLQTALTDMGVDDKRMMVIYDAGMPKLRQYNT